MVFGIRKVCEDIRGDRDRVCPAFPTVIGYQNLGGVGNTVGVLHLRESMRDLIFVLQIFVFMALLFLKLSLSS